MVGEQGAVVLLGQVDRPPDAALELLHGIEDGLHQVQPDDVVGGPGDNDVQVGVQILGGLEPVDVRLHGGDNLIHAADILGQGALGRKVGCPGFHALAHLDYLQGPGLLVADQLAEGVAVTVVHQRLDHRAAALVAHHQAGRGEDVEGLAHRGTGDAEHGGEFALRRQFVARGEITGKDRLADLVGNLTGNLLGFDRLEFHQRSGQKEIGSCLHEGTLGIV